METGPRLQVSSDRLVKPGIEPATPGLQGKRFIHYITAAPTPTAIGPACDEGTNLRLRDFAVVPLMPTRGNVVPYTFGMARSGQLDAQPTG